MIKSITVENFTVIGKKTTLKFAKGLNVVIGENGVGKSHLLKLTYALVAVSHEASKKVVNKEMFQKMVAEKLIVVFRPDTLGRLVHRARGSNRCTIDIKFTQNKFNFSFYFSTRSKTDVIIEKMPDKFIETTAVFIPTREMLSIYPGFASAYKDGLIEFDETYYDLCTHLDRRVPTGFKGKTIAPLIEKLEDVIHGKVYVDHGRFYLKMPDRGNMEIPLVAEGLRKLAMLLYLIANRSIKTNSMLFWDEPETNLNPKLIRKAADSIMELAKNNIQVFIATHSLFLLRELDILSMQETYRDVAQRYFALGWDEEQGVATLEQGDDSDSIEPIVSLDESLMQSDRYLELE